MSDIGVKRPHEVRLISEIERVIDEVAPENMTHVEVIGVLEIVKLRLFDESLSVNKTE